LVVSLRSIRSTNPEVIEKIRTEADYFERNAERMRYPKFRQQHLFVGSGVIEAGCKTVIGWMSVTGGSCLAKPCRRWRRTNSGSRLSPLLAFT